jgi:hypothetical protein
VIDARLPAYTACVLDGDGNRVEGKLKTTWAEALVDFEALAAFRAEALTLQSCPVTRQTS